MNTKIRVLRLTPYFYFENEGISVLDLDYEPLGGMQVQIMEQTKAISELCESQVVLTTGLPQIPRNYNLASNTYIISVRVPMPIIRYKSKGHILLLPSWALGTILWSLKNKLLNQSKFDVIHHHTSDLLGSFISAPIVAWILGLPLVLTIHSSPTFTFIPHTFTERLFFKLSKTVEKWAVGQSDLVYTLTKRTFLLYKEAGMVSDARIKVVSDGVNTEVFRKASTNRVLKFIKDFNIPAGKKIISYIGRIAPEKGWENFVKMANEIKQNNIHFLVCGDGHTRKAFEQQVGRFGLADMFTFTGYIEHERIAEALSVSSCLVLPSYHEELGEVILEAMACETPVVASKVGGVPYVITDNQTGFLVQPNDSVLLAKKVLWVLENEFDAQRVIKNARDYVVKEFSISTIADRIVEGYGFVTQVTR